MSNKKVGKAEQYAFIKICELISEMSLGIHGAEEHRIIFNKIDSTLRKNHDYQPYKNVQNQLREFREVIGWYVETIQELRERQESGDIAEYGDLLHKLMDYGVERGHNALRMR